VLLPPLLSSSMNFERWSRQGAHDASSRATAIYEKILEEYVPPPLDDAYAKLRNTSAAGGPSSATDHKRAPDAASKD